MRADAAELYQRWWPVALRHSSRWAASEADAEDIAAAAIVAFIEEAPDGLSDRVIERALAKTISRSREDARRAGRGGFLPPAESEAVTDVDTATWERVRDALGSADLALIELASARTGGTAPHGTWAASASRRR